MLYYAYFFDAGVPKTGLSPDWESLVTAENGTDKSGSAPTITEVGGGFYKFEITHGTAPWDVEGEDLVGVIDGGSSLIAADRYKPAIFSKRGTALARLTHKRDRKESDGTERVYGVDGTDVELELTYSDNDTHKIFTPGGGS